MLTWFVCTTNNGPLVALTASLFHETQSWRLSLRGHGCTVGSGQKSPCHKSALVEAALDRFLGSDDAIDDTATMAHHLAGLSRQLEELDRNLRIANETAALHARFHLAVTPLLPAGEQGAACALGAERFEEFATQVGRRVDLGVPLIRETIDRVSATRTNPFTRAEGEPSGTGSTVYEPGVQASSMVDDAPVNIPGVREDAATLAFQAVEAALFTDAGTCRGIEPNLANGSETDGEGPGRTPVADPARLPAIRRRLLLCWRTYRHRRREKPSCTEWSRSVEVLSVQPLVRMSCPGSPDPYGSIVNRWAGALCIAERSGAGDTSSSPWRRSGAGISFVLSSLRTSWPF